MITDSSLINVSLLISIITFVIYIVNNVYDVLTKSDIEKCLTYKGKDRILSGFLLFFLIVLMITISTLEQLKENNVLLSIIVIMVLSVALFLLVLFILAVVHVILIWTNFYPTFEVKIDNDKEEYWEIYKVTKLNRVILKKRNEYLTFSNVKELDDKIIRKQEKSKKDKNNV